MYFMFKKCFIFENYVGVKMEIYNAKSLDTFSRSAYNMERSKQMEALPSEQALLRTWLLGHTKSKLS